ncbi:MAG: hypothetical protein E6J20_20440 [Chloroflexi bacterium]|nr:MAG: hypothetical protein E6J20_20440 [Chloroflexota bacterium]
MADVTAGQTAQAGVGAPRGMRRWLPALPGVLYVVTFVVAFLMVQTPNDDEADKKWTDFYGDRGHQIQLLVTGFLLVIAAMLLLTFLTRLHSRIYGARTLDQRDPLPLVAAGTAGALIAAGGIVGATIPGAEIFGPHHTFGADILRLTSDMSFPLIVVGGGFAIAVAIAVITRAAQRSGYFGNKLSIFSYVAAAAAVAEFVFFPILVVLIWVLVVSVVLARRPSLATG